MPFWYFPGSQLSHSAVSAPALYFPPGQKVQLLFWPPLHPSLLYFPGLHAEHGLHAVHWPSSHVPFGHLVQFPGDAAEQRTRNSPSSQAAHGVHSMAPLPDLLSSPTVYVPLGHATHGAAGAAVAWRPRVPAGQSVQVFAPGAAPWSVAEPAGHSAHRTEDSDENLPAAQATHVRAPVVLSVSVTLPAGHAVQGTSARGEKVPTMHGVHERAPPALPCVFVTEPFAQASQGFFGSADQVSGAHASQRCGAPAGTGTWPVPHWMQSSTLVLEALEV